MNFVGAGRKLRELYDLLARKDVQNATSHFCTQREIIPSRAPSFGELWKIRSQVSEESTKESYQTNISLLSSTAVHYSDANWDHPQSTTGPSQSSWRRYTNTYTRTLLSEKTFTWAKIHLSQTQFSQEVECIPTTQEPAELGGQSWQMLTQLEREAI